MNELKAIDLLKLHKRRAMKDCAFVEEFDLAIQALEKQVPKKPMSMQSREPEYMCTTCGFKFYGTSMTICLHCGQRLNWEVENETIN